MRRQSLDGEVILITAGQSCSASTNEFGFSHAANAWLRYTLSLSVAEGLYYLHQRQARVHCSRGESRLFVATEIRFLKFSEEAGQLQAVRLVLFLRASSPAINANWESHIFCVLESS